MEKFHEKLSEIVQMNNPYKETTDIVVKDIKKDVKSVLAEKYPQDYREMIKAISPKEVGAADLYHLLYLADTYNLDPLKKEIYIIMRGGKPTYYISRDGYIASANRSGAFDGLESDAVYIGDKLTKRIDGSYQIEYGDAHLAFDNSKITGAFANVWRKDRSKIAGVAFISYKDNHKGKMWDDYPSVMATKVAEIHALRKAFSVNLGEGDE